MDEKKIISKKKRFHPDKKKTQRWEKERAKPAFWTIINRGVWQFHLPTIWISEYVRENATSRIGECFGDALVLLRSVPLLYNQCQNNNTWPPQEENRKKKKTSTVVWNWPRLNMITSFCHVQFWGICVVLLAGISQFTDDRWKKIWVIS